MMNTKSLLALLMVFALVVVAVGLARFGLDFWSHFHAAANANDSSSNHLDYRGIGGMICGGGIFLFSFLLYRRKRKV